MMPVFAFVSLLVGKYTKGKGRHAWKKVDVCSD